MLMKNKHIADSSD